MENVFQMFVLTVKKKKKKSLANTPTPSPQLGQGLLFLVLEEINICMEADLQGKQSSSARAGSLWVGEMLHADNTHALFGHTEGSFSQLPRGSRANRKAVGSPHGDPSEAVKEAVGTMKLPPCSWAERLDLIKTRKMYVHSEKRWEKKSLSSQFCYCL